jgi:GNAT superfamily N-acetyltransferase
MIDSGHLSPISVTLWRISFNRTSILNEFYHTDVRKHSTVAEVPQGGEDTTMLPIVRRMRVLSSVPAEIRADGITLRQYRGEDDIAAWLAIRNRAFSSLETAGRAWTDADFQREFVAQPWWRPEWMWFAVPSNQEASDAAVGTVTLAMRETPSGLRPAVHWLCVLPEWRRRGVARLLMATLERNAWYTGLRQICLETHANWKEAAGFYDRLGYEIIIRGSQS